MSSLVLVKQYHDVTINFCTASSAPEGHSFVALSVLNHLLRYEKGEKKNQGAVCSGTDTVTAADYRAQQPAAAGKSGRRRRKTGPAKGGKGSTATNKTSSAVRRR